MTFQRLIASCADAVPWPAGEGPGLRSIESAPIPVDETERLATLAALELLDTAPERDFDSLVAIARTTLGCKIGLISLVDAERQWFKAKSGLEADETPRAFAFCAHAVAMDALLVVPDATADHRFAANPLVLGAPHIRFYAGMPIRAEVPGVGGGPATIGTLCVIDDQPRDLREGEAAVMRDLAHLCETLIRARLTAKAATRLAAEQHAMLHDLERQRRLFAKAERIAGFGSWQMSLPDRRQQWSDQVFAIFGLPVGPAPTVDVSLELCPPSGRETVRVAMETAIATGRPFDVESDFETGRGERRRMRTSGEMEVRDGKAVGLIGVVQDVTNRYALEQSLRLRADIDDLTGIANRASFNQELDNRLGQARAQGEPLALLLIDLDHFKQVNDRCGHLAGDKVLRTMASRLRAPCFDGCFVARLGGDEFVVLVSGKECDHLDWLIERLLGDLRQTVVFTGGQIDVSGTIGASWFDASVADRSDLMHRADTALYAAKRARRGSAKVFGSG